MQDSRASCTAVFSALSSLPFGNFQPVYRHPFECYLFPVQEFADAQLAAEALATAINSDPASVFKTLIAQKVHGKAYNVAIAGPSAEAPTGVAISMHEISKMLGGS